MKDLSIFHANGSIRNQSYNFLMCTDISVALKVAWFEPMMYFYGIVVVSMNSFKEFFRILVGIQLLAKSIMQNQNFRIKANSNFSSLSGTVNAGYDL